MDRYRGYVHLLRSPGDRLRLETDNIENETSIQTWNILAKVKATGPVAQEATIRTDLQIVIGSVTAIASLQTPGRLTEERRGGMNEEKTLIPTSQRRVHEQLDRAVDPQPFADVHAHHQIEEKIYSQTDDHPLAVTPLEDRHREGDLGHHLVGELVVHRTRRDTEISPPILVDALRNANDDFPPNEADLIAIDHLSEVHQEVRVTDLGQEPPHVGGNLTTGSSPPIHPDRASLAGSQPRSPAHPTRDHYDNADSASFRGRSPAARSVADGDQRSRETDVSTPRDEVQLNGEIRQPPSGPSSYRNGTYERPPPTGPSRSFSQPIQSPPTGPAASMSMSAHNRGGGASTLNAPTRPRGAIGRFDGPPSRDFSGPPMRGRGGLPFRGPAPYGPRGGGYGRGGDFGTSNRGDYGGGGTYRGGFGRGGPAGGESTFPFRGNSSTSMTYPRTQRFNTVQQHLATNEKIVTGGKLLPTGVPPDQEKRIKMLEAEAERMRTEISEKQKLKREVLNEWDVRERESEREALRSDLAEQHLQQLMEGEDGIGRAAF
ncbi:uncharacterized protein A1O5_08956 [Cladophialophora psammophila CBS 110553]|uniref:Uncharacterized protein n=1 Tax=Cladophialophora psammophila CBS 110553 TaxID=1182543 RepID=W9WRI8_9EURO|nr:uncharacterized protein A1O5_08956 [Cladophialophora psammophila CBS 110553]EXJ67610.1 hypothetical protein A1O5_08956 [Cladophialophora psammophila CBS 110553]